MVVKSLTSQGRVVTRSPPAGVIIRFADSPALIITRPHPRLLTAQAHWYLHTLFSTMELTYLDNISIGRRA